MKKRADQLKQGDYVVLLENHVAIVVCNWEQEGRPFRSIVLRNISTNASAEMSIASHLQFDVVDPAIIN